MSNQPAAGPERSSGGIGPRWFVEGVRRGVREAEWRASPPLIILPLSPSPSLTFSSLLVSSLSVLTSFHCCDEPTDFKHL